MNVINVKENNPIKRKSTIKQIPAKKPKIEESTDTTTNILWTDKYRPTKMNKLVGQHGPKSAANQLSEWLGQWRDQDTNDIPGAALLSGLPGLGKTTSALIVSKEMGFSPIELNASDKRSKKMLESGLAVSISNKTITSFFKKKEKRQELDKNAIIIMDEVDGMAGNEDRGGVSLLIDLIKKTTIPIICICNDASLPKMRSLSKYCLHLKFNRYRVEQIKAHLMSICFKENVSVESNALTNMIEKSDRDIRQCINNLQIMASQNKKLDFDLMYKYSNDSKKPTKLNAFDIARYYITPMGSNANSIKIKLEHFFNEYDVVPLMVQENYIKVISSNRSMSKLEALSKAANSMAVGDMIFNQIRSMNRWNLLPEYGFAGAYYPGELIRGQLGFMDLRFPQWFGKNSSRNKNMRLIQQIIKHSCLKCDSFTISSSPDSLFYYYLIIKKCLNNDFEEFFNFMQEYAFSREDVETILDIASITSSFKMDTKTKRTLTKKLKSVSRNLPYSTSEDVKKSKKTKLVKSEPETESEPESEDTEYDEY
ncbi:hypothetical protein A3Q56_06250 [Intoshia linei]|uniref:AAA+ ATPase domain-containing protein n=1 Tax=Intoshia linei TaxID=1819745 RepID=A0A177AVK9_9BILA|nr:hypothetical protein A3Q56_06250 [Intoshia linei]